LGKEHDLQDGKMNLSCDGHHVIAKNVGGVVFAGDGDKLVAESLREGG
jgi:hypothetical protein